MEVIMLTGTLAEKSEKKKSKSGFDYIRFRVLSEGRENLYRCYCYNMDFTDMQKGDKVFVAGDLEISKKMDAAGKERTNLDVFVKKIELL